MEYPRKRTIKLRSGVVDVDLFAGKIEQKNPQMKIPTKWKILQIFSSPSRALKG